MTRPPAADPPVAAPPAPTSVRTWRRLLLADARPADVAGAFALVTVVAATGVAVGYQGYEHTAGAVGAGTVAIAGSFGDVLLGILGQNVGAALLAFSGVVTFGVTTLVSLMLTGTWVGATAHALVADVGAGTLAGRVGAYLPFELAGLLVVATAGALPAVAVVAGMFRSGPRTTFAQSMGTALRLLVLGLAVILVGAVVESALVVGAR